MFLLRLVGKMLGSETYYEIYREICYDEGVVEV